MNKKTIIAVWADAPVVTTGFGRIAREIIGSIYEDSKPEIHWLGINYNGDPHNFPYQIYPACRFMSNDKSTLGSAYLERFLYKVKPDIFFCLEDPWVIYGHWQMIERAQKELGFTTIFYMPIDSIQYPEWTETMMKIDVPVVYTEWGKKICTKITPKLEKKLKVIHHGVDTSVFKPLDDISPDILKSEVYGKNLVNRTIFLNINRNTPRKQLALCLEALALVKKQGHNPFLYLHANPIEFDYNLFRIGERLGLTEQDFMTLPKGFPEHAGFPDSDICLLYNGADAIISSTTAEGWGLSFIEAAACKKLIIYPDLEPLTSLLYNRGLPYEASGRVYLTQDISRPHQLPSYKALAQQMIRVIKGPKKFDHYKQAAYKWAVAHDWSKIRPLWVKLFNEAYENRNLYHSRSKSSDDSKHDRVRDSGRKNGHPGFSNVFLSENNRVGGRRTESDDRSDQSSRLHPSKSIKTAENDNQES